MTGADWGWRYLFRLALGLIFVFAALAKIGDPTMFAKEIHNFRMIPVSMENLMALTLPWIELVAGLGLILNLTPRSGIVVVTGLLIIFVVAIVAALIRNLDIECGCFGTADASSVGWVTLARDAGDAGHVLARFPQGEPRTGSLTRTLDRGPHPDRRDLRRWGIGGCHEHHGRGGSLITLPLLIFAGLPATVANGTNRVAITLQNIAAVAAFRKEGIPVQPRAWLLLVPCVGGAVVGANLAVDLDEALLRKIIGAVLLVMLIPLLRKRGSAGDASRVFPRIPGWGWVAYFFVGVYGGFIQAGIGYLFLFMLVGSADSTSCAPTPSRCS